MFGWWAEKDLGFKPVPDIEETEEFLSNSERSSLDFRSSWATTRGPTWLVVVVIVIVTAVSSAALGVYASRTWLLDADGFSIRHTSQHCKFSW